MRGLHEGIGAEMLAPMTVMDDELVLGLFYSGRHYRSLYYAYSQNKNVGSCTG